MSDKILTEIFKTLTPDNMQNNETINTLFSVYLDYLDETNLISSDPLLATDVDYLNKRIEETGKQRYLDIKSELFAVYLQELTTTFEEAESDEAIYNKFKTIYEKLGLPTDDLKIVSNLDKELNAQYIEAAKDYKQKKGTTAGFFFIYDIINKSGIQELDTDDFFRIFEGSEENPKEPFVYRVEASIYKEVFEKIIRPLSHPVGFEYIFYRLLILTLEDYFGLRVTSTITRLEMFCFDLETETTTQTDLIKGKIVTDYLETINQEEFSKVIFTLEDEETLENTRIVKDYDNKVQEFELDNLRILSVQLDNSADGEISNIEYYDDGSVKLIEYKQFSLNDNKSVVLDFVFVDDSLGRVNSSSIPLDLFNSLKIDQNNKTYFETRVVSAAEIIDTCWEYWGRLKTDFPQNCRIEYDVTKTEEVTTTDVSQETKDALGRVSTANPYTEFKQSTVADNWVAYNRNEDTTINDCDRTMAEDNWSRNYVPGTIDFFIGTYIKDAATTPLYQEPFIGTSLGADGLPYEIGVTGDALYGDYLTNLPDEDNDLLENGSTITKDNLEQVVYTATSLTTAIATGVEVENLDYLVWENMRSVLIDNPTDNMNYFAYNTNIIDEDGEIKIAKDEFTALMIWQTLESDDVSDFAYNTPILDEDGLAKLAKDAIDLINSYNFTAKQSLNDTNFEYKRMSLTIGATYDKSHYTFIDGILTEVITTRDVIIGDTEKSYILDGGPQGDKFYYLEIGENGFRYQDLVEGDSFQAIEFDINGNVVSENIYDESADFKVYRDGVLLDDNNYSSL